MKRIVCVLMVAMMLYGSAIGEGIDLKTMTIDELVALRNQITDELKSRVVDEGDQIYAGTYVVGKDIKAGVYLLSTETAFYDNVGYSLYADEENYVNKRTIDWGRIAVGYKLKMELEDGMIIDLHSGIFTLVPYPEQNWSK